MNNKQTMEKITNKVIEAMETGNYCLWSKPWHGVVEGAYNRVTKKPYSLMNQLLLWPLSGEFATFKQWSDLGGKIKKGAKAHTVCFWKPNKTEKKDEDGNVVTDEDGKTVYNTYFILRYYNVFHISDVEGVEPLPVDERPNTQFADVSDAETIIENYRRETNLKIDHRASNDAYYQPSTDTVVLPKKTQFNTVEDYYSTAFHELTHSTGSVKRLDRGLVGHFGSHEYSKEELVAELGAWYLSSILGLDTENTAKQSQAYLVGWLSALKKDPTMLVSAATKAEKAVSYMLSFTATSDDESEVVIPDYIKVQKYDLDGMQLSYNKSVDVDVIKMGFRQYAIINTDFDRATNEYYDKLCSALFMDRYTDLDADHKKRFVTAFKKDYPVYRKGNITLCNKYFRLSYKPRNQKKSVVDTVQLENHAQQIAVYDVKKGA